MTALRRALAALTLLAAGSAAAAQAPLTYAREDYSFRYPPRLVVYQDYVYADASVPGSKHVVVLRHRDAQAGDLRSIEINMLRSLRARRACADYASCRLVDGVTIGTDSEDPEMRAALDVIAGSFRRASASAAP